MINFYFGIITIIQVIILYFVILLLKQTRAIRCFHNIRNSKPLDCENTGKYELIDNINYLPTNKLIKQCINLNNYSISFVAPYSGFLYLSTKYAEIYCNKKKRVEVVKHIEKFFIPQGTNISIKNIQQLKNVRFTKWTIEDFIEDINRGVFINISGKTGKSGETQ